MIVSECGGGGGVVEGDGRVEEDTREFVGRLEMWRGWRERERAKVKDGNWGGNEEMNEG
jgi:hypothetical protein